MQLNELAKALSSETRLKIIKILSERELSALEVYEAYERAYKEGKHRESIYRELEKLVEANILKKVYNEKEKKIVYKLAIQKIIVDLPTQRVEIIPKK